VGEVGLFALNLYARHVAEGRGRNPRLVSLETGLLEAGITTAGWDEPSKRWEDYD